MLEIAFCKNSLEIASGKTYMKILDTCVDQMFLVASNNCNVNVLLKEYYRENKWNTALARLRTESAPGLKHPAVIT